MDKGNKKIKKELVKNFYKGTSLLIAFLSSCWLWYFNISPYWEENYFGYMTLFLVGVLFCVTYWIFAKMYHAQKIGIYRLTELTYFQLLAFALTDVVLFVESVIWFHGFERLRVWSYFVTFAAQMIAIVVTIFVYNRLYAKCA